MSGNLSDSGSGNEYGTGGLKLRPMKRLHMKPTTGCVATRAPSASLSGFPGPQPSTQGGRFSDPECDAARGIFRIWCKKHILHSASTAIPNPVRLAIASSFALALLFVTAACTPEKREPAESVAEERRSAVSTAAAAREAEERRQAEERLRQLDVQIVALEAKREVAEREKERLGIQIRELQTEIADCSRASRELGLLASGVTEIRDRAFLLGFLDAWLSLHVVEIHREVVIKRLLSGEESAECLEMSHRLDRQVAEIAEKLEALQEPWKAAVAESKECEAKMLALQLQRFSAGAADGDGRNADEAVPGAVSKEKQTGERI